MLKENKNFIGNKWIVNLIFFLIPFEYLLPMWPFRIFLIVISLYLIITQLLVNITWTINIYVISYLFFFLNGFLSLIYTRNSTSTKSILLEVFPYLIFSVALSLFLSSKNTAFKKKLHQLLLSFLIGTILISVYSIIYSLFNFNNWLRVGLGVYPPDKYTMYSYYLIVSICISFYFFCVSIRYKKIAYAMVCSFLYGVSLFTAIRKAMIIPVLYMLFYIILRNNNLKRVLKSLFWSILFVIFLLILFNYLNEVSEVFRNGAGQQLHKLLNFRNDQSIDNSLSDRSLLRKTAKQALFEYPLFGYGFGAFRNYASEHIGLSLYAHNNYLEILASSGVIGFIIYYYSFVVMLVKLSGKMILNQKENLYKFTIAFILATLISDYGTVSYLSFPYMVIFTICGTLSSITMKGDMDKNDK